MRAIYERLFAAFGPQRWWPGETPFEVAVGAVLTQNAAWVNVERAIANLKAAGALEPRTLLALPESELARLIRPAGYFNVKARRLRSLVLWIAERLGGDVARLREWPIDEARAALLAVHGVGPETADSILLYAARHETFVVDAYTRRVLSRHGLARDDASYDDLKALFERHLPREERLFNEYHALIVRVGKDLCRPTPRCDRCPLAPLGGPGVLLPAAPPPRRPPVI